jgi:hypothetical protein
VHGATRFALIILLVAMTVTMLSFVVADCSSSPGLRKTTRTAAGFPGADANPHTRSADSTHSRRPALVCTLQLRRSGSVVHLTTRKTVAFRALAGLTFGWGAR